MNLIVSLILHTSKIIHLKIEILITNTKASIFINVLLLFQI